MYDLILRSHMPNIKKYIKLKIQKISDIQKNTTANELLTNKITFGKLPISECRSVHLSISYVLPGLPNGCKST